MQTDTVFPLKCAVGDKMDFDELLYKAFDEYTRQETERIDGEIGNQTVEFSDRFKRNMNRMFRE